MMADRTHNGLTFEPMTLPDLLQMHHAYWNTPGWPQTLSTVPLCEQFVADWSIRSFFGTGEFSAIRRADDRLVIGFTTLSKANENFVPDGVNAVEAGTFLVPQVRGTGVNAQVKQYLRDQASDVFAASHIVYLVDTENKRAQQALQKLPYPVTKVEMTDTHHPWHRYLRRRVFEERRDGILFIQEL
ncbi:hypothetical protein N007_06095 [Alicyclobacillus acidoterrestris ATCC 49025]|nr:hypothetical protein N007_06095 [Alicyclobacillus acidoterrestris ATCC 49025]